MSCNGVANDELSIAQAQALVWNHTCSYIVSMSIKCAIELGIPDIIHDHGSPMALPDLVSALAIPESRVDSLCRLMRLLTHSGIFALRTESTDKPSNGHVVEEGTFLQEAYALTAASRLLLKGKPSSIVSMRPMAAYLLDPSIVQPFDALSQWFRNAEPVTPFEMHHGKGLWDQCARHPGLNMLLNEGMASDYLVVVNGIIDKCRRTFEQSASMVDVGGGTGLLARGIGDAFPHLEVTVVDLPHVVCGLEGSKNLRFMAGDMFKSIPPANIILLKWILHDWNDEECVKILKRCKEAIRGGDGKVIVIETVMEDQKEAVAWSETELLLDMAMMSTVTGKERSRKEWAKLFFDAGFGKYWITPLVGSRCIIEVHP